MNAAEEQKMLFLPLSASTCQVRCFSKVGPSESALQMFAWQAASAAEASPPGRHSEEAAAAFTREAFAFPLICKIIILHYRIEN